MLYEFSDSYNLVLITEQLKVGFFVLESLTLEHTLAKRISCGIYRKGNEEHLHQEMVNNYFKIKNPVYHKF